MFLFGFTLLLHIFIVFWFLDQEKENLYLIMVYLTTNLETK